MTKKPSEYAAFQAAVEKIARCPKCGAWRRVLPEGVRCGEGCERIMHWSLLGLFDFFKSEDDEPALFVARQMEVRVGRCVKRLQLLEARAAAEAAAAAERLPLLEALAAAEAPAAAAQPEGAVAHD